MKVRSVRLAVVLLIVVAVLAGANGTQEDPPTETYSIGVYVPGVVEGSATYELLVAGVSEAADEVESAEVTVIEGGFNQSLWEQGITSMAASGAYDLIVTSNPEMPDLVGNVSAAFPDSRFLILDAYLAGNEQVHTVMFNQREQAFLAGYFAGLVGMIQASDAVTPLRAGLLAGQEYPIMNQVILPGFEMGLRSVDPEATVDFRVLGNWYDAGRAAELASSIYATGSHIILPIAGGGNQGVIAAARERETYVVWYDTPGLDEAPGIVIGSTFIALDRAAYERVRAAIAGNLVYGEAEVLGVQDGYVGFVDTDPLYSRHVDQAVQDAMEQILNKLVSGEFYLEMPLF